MISFLSLSKGLFPLVLSCPFSFHWDQPWLLFIRTCCAYNFSTSSSVSRFTRYLPFLTIVHRLFFHFSLSTSCSYLDQSKNCCIDRRSVKDNAYTTKRRRQINLFMKLVHIRMNSATVRKNVFRVHTAMKSIDCVLYLICITDT